MTETEISQQYCVRWNSHLCSLGTAFPQFLTQKSFVDVTLACEGQKLHCHKMVLAACSQYFEAVLAEHPCQHPIIILPKDIKFWTVQALVEFMYKGQVNVSQAGLPDLVKTGDLLQIRGLCNTDIGAGLTAQASQDSASVKVSPQPSESQTISSSKATEGSFEDEKAENAEVDDENMETGEAKDRTLEPSDNDQPNENVASASTSKKNEIVTDASGGAVTVGQIRVKPIENLFENYKKDAENRSAQAKVTETVIIDIDEHPLEELETDEETVVPDDPCLPPSLHYNKHIMDISIKTKRAKGQKKTSYTFGPKDYDLKPEEVSEIVCVPSMDEFGEMDDDESLCEIPDYDPCSMDAPPLLQYSEKCMMRQGYAKILPKPSFSNGHNNMEDTDQKVMKGLMLRSPRGNQPRTYTQDELFQALNAIKSGLSIYRASQRFKVPRKTLRNWMKRWQIKSVFPMPAQLQRAAEKKRNERDQILASISVYQENQVPKVENLIS